MEGEFGHTQTWFRRPSEFECPQSRRGKHHRFPFSHRSPTRVFPVYQYFPLCEQHRWDIIQTNSSTRYLLQHSAGGLLQFHAVFFLQPNYITMSLPLSPETTRRTCDVFTKNRTGCAGGQGMLFPSALVVERTSSSKNSAPTEDDTASTHSSTSLESSSNCLLSSTTTCTCTSGTTTVTVNVVDDNLVETTTIERVHKRDDGRTTVRVRFEPRSSELNASSIRPLRVAEARA